jgi:DNA helicase II / ATP-dependent DNA helicase PcrA
MASIERWIGGPGTGKTRLIQGELTASREALGLSTAEVGCCTFTRAGRAELSERVAAAWGCEPEALTRHGWFRTAHSIAFKQAGVEDGRLLEGGDGAEWIGDAIGQKIIAKRKQDGETEFESGEGNNSATLSLKAWELARQTMTTLSSVIQLWSSIGDEAPMLREAQAIVDKYELAKTREGRLDFTDLVSLYAGVKHTTREGPVEVDPVGDVPESLKVLAIDEAQDSSAIVDRICRRLASSPSMERVLIVGDPYQSIFGFGGSDFRHFLSWDAVEKTMPQSYRCPPVVMKLGEACIRQMRSGYRDRGIIPAKHEGRVEQAFDVHDAISKIKPDKSVLILGRCAFSLADYESQLTSAGIPYSWIDASPGGSALSGYRALWDLEHGEVVSGQEWAAAVSILAVKHKELGKLLAHGEKTAWAKGQRSDIDLVLPVPEYMAMAGCEQPLIDLIKSGRWTEAMDTKHAGKADAWRRCAAAHGPELATNPKVRLSTIHSAKGCEGDTVILSTVSSKAVETARLSLAARWDEECRVNYVAVTRARENLVVVDDGGKYRLEIP